MTSTKRSAIARFMVVAIAALILVLLVAGLYYYASSQSSGALVLNTSRIITASSNSSQTGTSSTYLSPGNSDYQKYYQNAPLPATSPPGSTTPGFPCIGC